MKKTFIGLTVLAVCMAFASCGEQKEEKQKTDEKPEVKLATVETCVVPQTETYTATVESDVKNNIAPNTPYRIEKIYVEVGDNVRKGQVLVQLDASNLRQLKLQIENQKVEFKRTEQLYQVGGATGFRDQLQDVLSILYSDPEAARRQILDHAAHQFAEGDVLHWWHESMHLGTRTTFSDDYLWLVFVTYQYLRVTGDESILNQRVAFCQSDQLGPGEAERCITYALPDEPDNPNFEYATLYEHLRRAINRSMNRIGSHGLPRSGILQELRSCCRCPEQSEPANAVSDIPAWQNPGCSPWRTSYRYIPRQTG